jgi:hypothetical protein
MPKGNWSGDHLPSSFRDPRDDRDGIAVGSGYPPYCERHGEDSDQELDLWMEGLPGYSGNGPDWCPVD